MSRLKIGAIVSDVEGTATTIAFVREKLFPYARTHLSAFVENRADDPEVSALLAEARALAGQPDFDTPHTIRLLQDWIDADKKATPLKTLQGLIWDDGFRRGELVGDVYPDVPPALRRWHDAGMKLYVYSSGSVQAQRLVFGYTPFGDLTPLFSGYFDTRVGSKLEQASYRVIAAAIDTTRRDPVPVRFRRRTGRRTGRRLAHHGARPRRGGAAGAASASGRENLRRRGAAFVGGGLAKLERDDAADDQ